jgi:hypothetical protein
VPSKLPAIDLGLHRGGLKDGKPFKVELELLMEQNLLLQANSGGGKSWALRRLIEQAYGKLPIIIIDPEGEFSTLRAKYDFLLVGKGGETPADPRSAKLLAHRLLELRISAICNLFELAPAARAAWVATFIEAIVEAPKDLWGDVLVAIDEAHDFAPEKGHGRTGRDSSTASTAALVALASKGRKRGQVTVAATQRLGKLAKDFAAELKNVLIGQTWIDIDRERAAEALGISKAGKGAFFEQIKAIPPGHFYGLGRALALEPTRVHVGPVQTEHPTRGHRQAATPPPTAKILHLLPQLGDLPKEAEQKAATEAELRAQVARLRAELAAKPKPLPPQKRVPAALQSRLILLSQKANGVIADLENLRHDAAVVRDLADAAKHEASAPPSRATPGPSFGGDRAGWTGGDDDGERSPRAKGSARARSDHEKALDAVESTGFSSSALRGALAAGFTPDVVPSETGIKLLQTLKASHRLLTRRQLATQAGMKHSGGAYRGLVAELLRLGYVVSAGGALELTPAGSALAGEVRPPLTGTALIDFWAGKLGEPEASILRYVVMNAHGPDTAFPRAVIASELGKSAGGGAFRQAVSNIIANGLFEKRGAGQVSPSHLFFE